MIKKCMIFVMVVSTMAVLAPATAQTPEPGYNQFVGEVIHYDVRSLAVKQADALLELKGLVKVDGRDVYLITFEARGMKFLDIEKIYADPKDLYPVRVERDLNIWGSVEKIVETYDQDKFTVTVVKTTKAKPKPVQLVIQKKDRIDNIYCFIYRYRLTGDFRIGASLKLNLPTKDVSMEISKKATLEAAEKTFDTVFLETIPAQYRLWFDMSNRKIPLRIDKLGMVGGTSMIMNNYIPKGVSDDSAK